MIGFILRTIGAECQHEWCGGLTPFVLGINMIVGNVRKVRGCQYYTIVQGVVYNIA